MSEFLTAFLALWASLVSSVPILRAVNPALIAPLPQATVVFVGDMQFDRYIRIVSERRDEDFVFSCIDEELQNADLVVGNLEGPITSLPSMSASSTIGTPENMTFTFPTTTAPLLWKHNIGLVNLGNNHSMNFGRDGYLQTLNALDAAGVAHFGDPDKPESKRVARIDVRGVPFSFVNWSDWTSDKTDHTVAQVRAERESGRVPIVYAHWGEEYAATSSPRTQQLAHSFVDAGTVLVVGSHPHVTQEYEEYKDASIYYSLGNFIFDQYWNEAVRTGLMLRVVFVGGAVESVEEIPVRLEKDGRTCPVRATVAL